MSAARTLHPSPRTLEVENLVSFDGLVAAGARSMHGWHLQSLDLRGRRRPLESLNVTGAIFLGCSFDDGVEDSLRGRGALIFPKLGSSAVQPLPWPALHAAGALRRHCRDPVRGHHGRQGLPMEHPPRPAAPAGRHARSGLHDHSIGDALEELTRSEPCRGHTMVGVMGGHAANRGAAAYTEAALLGRLLARNGRVVATGGGPGTMEAANLGAYLSAADEADFQRALSDLAAVPGFRPSVSAWARAAAAVVERHPDGTPSLGIPTWFYGHEPPNYFATHIAKYFANAVREAILLELCDGGIIFLPGSGGTVQEIFQDACENYYGAPETVTPMVLVGREHWLRRFPVWPLLQSLAAGRRMEDQIFLVDNVEEALAVLDR